MNLHEEERKGVMTFFFFLGGYSERKRWSHDNNFDELPPGTASEEEKGRRK